MNEEMEESEMLGKMLVVEEVFVKSARSWLPPAMI